MFSPSLAGSESDGRHGNTVTMQSKPQHGRRTDDIHGRTALVKESGRLALEFTDRLYDKCAKLNNDSYKRFCSGTALPITMTHK